MLPDWTPHIWPTYENMPYFFVFGMVCGIWGLMIQSIGRHYITPLITSEEVKQLYFYNMRRKMIKIEEESLKKIEREKEALIKEHGLRFWEGKRNRHKAERSHLLLQQYKSMKIN